MSNKKKDTSNHYIDNDRFFHAMVEWKQTVIEAEESGEGRPPITNYIGECFMKIAEHLAYKPNFMNYPYKEEMIGDGIENCLIYAHNFDPNKSKNPFSYFTQIIYYAFLRRIEKEKKQSYVKYRTLMMKDVDGTFSKYYKENYFEDEKKESEEENEDDMMRGLFNLSENDIKKFTPKKRKKRKSSGTLEDVSGNEDSPDK